VNWAERLSLDRRVSTTVIYLASVAVLVFHLLAQRYLIDVPAPLYFLSIALISSAVLYQILAIRLTPGFAAVVLLEIIIAAIVFHLIYHIPTFGLYGSDAYYDLASAKAILESGHVDGVEEYSQITSFFPIVHILGADLSLVTDLDEVVVAKWFPTLIGAAVIPMVFLLSNYLFRQTKAALLAALLFAVLQHYVLFGSLFVRETVALVLAIGCVYFYVAAKSSEHQMAYRGLSILCLAGTVVAHHLTSAMLILLLALYWLFSSVHRSAIGRKLFRNTTGHRVSLSLLLLSTVGTLTYWLTTVVEPVQILAFFVENVLTPSEWGMRTIFEQETTGVVSIPTIRYFFLIYGSYITYLVFGMILLYRVFSRKRSSYIETPVFTSYLIICGAVGIMSYYLLPPTVGGDRFLAYGWLFAFGPLALAIVEFKRPVVKVFSVAFIFIFIFVNLYTIHPTLWDFRAKGAGGAAEKKVVALARSIDFSSGEVLG